MPIKDYSTDPDLNVQISGINIAEGCPPSGINNAIRQLMADLKEESEAKAEAITAVGEALEANLAGKLDKSGGTMTGVLRVQDSEIRVGRSNYSKGEIPTSEVYQRIAFVDKDSNALGVLDNTVTPNTGRGRFRLVTYDTDGVMGAFQLMKPVGANPYGLIGNDTVFTSAGGTLSGQLQFSAAAGNIEKQNSSGRMVVRGGTDWADGGVIVLGGQDDTAGFASQVYMHSSNGGSVKHRLVVDTGGVTIDGSPVITQTAKKSDDSTGNYVKYSNGLIIQWGSSAFATGAVKTLPTPFAGYYSVVALHQGSANIDVQVNDLTSTTFTVRHSYNQAVSIMWIAIGF